MDKSKMIFMPINFNNNKLENHIRQLINKHNERIYMNDIINIESIYLEDSSINSLEGLNYLVNLRELSIINSCIKDIKEISNLINLTSLILSQSKIADISPVIHLKSLKFLDLSRNEIKDISPLKHLKELECLYLYDNKISDISDLQHLKNLKELCIGTNNIKSIDALSTLTNLEVLELNNNCISNISALTKLTKLTSLHINDNNIVDSLPLGFISSNLQILVKDDIREQLVEKNIMFRQFISEAPLPMTHFIGLEITHSNFGEGIIENISLEEDRIEIRFNNGKFKTFKTKSIGEHLIIQHLEKINGFIEYYKVNKEMNEKNMHIESLKNKYYLENLQRNDSEYDTIISVLERFDEGLPVIETEINLFISNTNKAIEALGYYMQYYYLKKEWSISRASRIYRNLGIPKLAISVTNCYSRLKDMGAKSASLVTRGAALKDIGELGDAEACAKTALSLNEKSHYPYNLLGSIYYLNGYPNKAEEYFNKALELGQNYEIYVSEVINSYNHATRDTKELILKYLKFNKQDIYKRIINNEN